MPKLSDTQTVLLSAASQRADLSFYPLPGTLAKGGPRVTKALAQLVTGGFAEERTTNSAEATSRIDGDLSYGLFATSAGLSAIGVEPEPGHGTEPVAPVEQVPAVAEPRITKAALVLTLLQRTDGATLPELIAATDWLPHTTRAALTGLRKRGHAIERGKRDDATCYRITAVA